MKEIPLTKGFVAFIDDDDYDRVIAMGKWQAILNISVNTYYAIHSMGKGNIRMNRFIMNTPKGMVCDHINGNTLDNRKSNLRNCTQTQNLWNTGHQKNNKLKQKYIRQLKAGTYEVHLRLYGESVFRKAFKTLEEAIIIRDEKAKIYYGEFTRTE